MLENYILEIRKFFPKTVCEKIISYYDNPEILGDAKIVSGLDKSLRNCFNTNFRDTKSFGQKIVKNFVEKHLEEAIKIYEEKFPNVSIAGGCSQIDFLKYPHNEYKAGYKFHVDMGYKVSERQLSISVCLNNDFEGGEFVFDLPNQKKQYPQNVGDVLIFPSNFMFPHQVNQVIKGTRYALVGWYI